MRVGGGVGRDVVFIQHKPFGGSLRGQRRTGRGDIGGRGQGEFMRSLDHRAREVGAGLQRGVLRAHARGIVTIAVMALGEHGDRVDISFLQRGLKLRLVEPAPHAGNMRRRMKIQMHLSCGQLSHVSNPPPVCWTRLSYHIGARGTRGEFSRPCKIEIFAVKQQIRRIIEDTLDAFDAIRKALPAAVSLAIK